MHACTACTHAYTEVALNPAVSSLQLHAHLYGTVLGILHAQLWEVRLDMLLAQTMAFWCTGRYETHASCSELDPSACFAASAKLASSALMHSWHQWQISLTFSQMRAAMPTSLGLTHVPTSLPGN